MKKIYKGKMVMQFAVAFAMIVTSLLSPGVAFAQDSSTPDASGTAAGDESQATEEPTTEPTVAPTEVPTDVPTEAPTTEPTQAPTESGELPTETPVEVTPTEEVTLTPTVTPTEEGTVSAQDITLGDPEGTIYTRTPVFTWDYDDAVYKYQLFVYQKSQKGDIKMYDKLYYASKICSDDTNSCKVKSPKSLAYGTYYWKLRTCDENGQCTDLDSSPSQEFIVASTTPTAEEPSGTKYDQTLTFTWLGVHDETDEKYYLLVYNSDKDKVINEALDPGDVTCADNSDGEYECSYSPSITFDLDTYKWRVRAYYKGSWRSYSSYKSFIVGAEINDDFSSFAKDITPISGSWQLNTTDGVYYTNGITKKFSSIRSNFIFTDVDVTAILKRTSGSVPEDGSYPASYIGVRMGKSKNGSNYNWYTGYIFGYTNAGTYAIWRLDSGTKVTTIQPWTDTDINVGDWNTLEVIAQGNDFEFLINDATVKTFTDDEYDDGYVGVEMYRPDSTILPLYIDNFSAELVSSTTISGATVSAAQAAANDAALKSSSVTGMIEGYDGGSVNAQATVPDPVSPTDTTVYTAKPTFTWNDSGDERYYLYLAKITTGGIDKVYGATLSAATYCDSGTCSYTSPSTLSQNDYLWKIKAYDGSDYSDYCDPQYFTVGTTMPTAKLPYSTGYDNEPEFSWTEIIDATQYNIVAYDSDSKKVISWWPSDSEVTCDDDTKICSVAYGDMAGRTDSGWIAPTDPLENGKYRWRVRAFINDRWGIFSPYRDFTVASEFESTFDDASTSEGWGRLWGGSWSRKDSSYYSVGKANSMTSVKYAYKYSNFTFSALVKREHPNIPNSSYPANYVAIRMGTSHTSDLQWYSGYLFGYTNAGYYSIWRVKGNGSAVALVPWTQSDDIIKGDWNTLTITADGDNFDFSINGALQNSVTNDADSEGYIGFEFYRPASAYLGKFYIDNAQLELLGSTTTSLTAQSAQSDATVSAEQQALNAAAASNQDPNWSIAGTPLDQ